ncbi:MAG: VgrG-related protein [Actinomycetota bacterium]|nr:VgrG-related protein [Actinomycetota bacterium]
MTGTTSAQIDILIDGAPLDPMVYGLLVSAEVDTSLSMPSQFRLVFRGPRTTVLEGGGLQLAAMVRLQVTTGGAPTPLLTGEITAVEVDYSPDGNLTIVRGLDRSHRLMKGTKTMAYPDMTASGAVTALVAEAGLLPGEIVSTSTVYPWLTQANVSAWVFIQQMAALENCVAYVDAMGLFNFGPMTRPQAGLPPVMTYDLPPEGTQLVMGRNLVRLRASVTSSEQVPEVNVMGWDPTMNMPVMGLGPSLPSTAQSIDPATLPAAVAEEFGATPFFETSRPFDTEGAASTRARAIAADISGALAELEGQCLGNPAILAGESVSLGMAGPPFDGQYVVSSARHVFDPYNGGYTTWFTVGGRQDRSLYALTSGGGGGGGAGTRPEVPGVVLATVTDNMDQEKLGRVKVMFPWLSDSYVSAWAPTVQMGAGVGGYGCLWLPEVGDQVLVAFDRGDVGHPYVIGNLYNSQRRPEPPPSIDGAVASRRIMSRMRHSVQFDDGPSALGITISDGDKTVTIKLDAEQQAITVTSAGQVTIEAAQGISMKSGGPFSVDAGGDISIKGVGVSVDSASSLSMVGASGATLEGANVSITAPLINLGA